MPNLSDYFPLSAISTTNYTITNTDASVDLTGWTGDVGTGIARRTNSYSPTGHTFWGDAQVDGGAYQDILAVQGNVTAADIDAGNVLLELSWYHGSYNGSDQNLMYVGFFDGTPGTLITDTIHRLPPYGIGPQELLAEPMTIQRIVYRVLPGTRTYRLYQRMHRLAGTDNNGYIVSMTLTGFVVL